MHYFISLFRGIEMPTDTDNKPAQLTHIATGDTSFRQAVREGLPPGEWLATQRYELGLNQTQLAANIQEDRTSISRFEKGHPASLGFAQALLDYFHIALADAEDFKLWVRGRLSAASAIRPDARHNLPLQLTPLIGRDPLLAAAMTLMQRTDRRLLTLTGPGGIGKTRFAVQLGMALVDAFRDGVWFVALATAEDASLVISSLARTLGIKDIAGQPLIETIKVYLHEKNLLLILDNFEQVISAAPLVADLLLSAPETQIVVTSRTVLSIYGEQEYPIPPLALPSLVNLPTVAQLRDYEAITLFLDRIQAVQPSFVLTQENAALVTAICVQLDGLPLAIELAAPLVRLLPLAALLIRLKNRLNALTGGPQNLPTRQQTLRSAIAWSYDLLTPVEQRLFARLSVFAGGWSLEAAEAICKLENDGDMDVFAELTALNRHSLIYTASSMGDAPRFNMLPTLGEYAFEQLAAGGELDVVAEAHTLYYLHQVEIVAAQDAPIDQNPGLDQLEADHDNLVIMMERAQLHGKVNVILRLRSVIWESGIGLAMARGAVGWIKSYRP